MSITIIPKKGLCQSSKLAFEMIKRSSRYVLTNPKAAISSEIFDWNMLGEPAMPISNLLLFVLGGKNKPLRLIFFKTYYFLQFWFVFVLFLRRVPFIFWRTQIMLEALVQKLNVNAWSIIWFSFFVICFNVGISKFLNCPIIAWGIIL